MLTHITKPSPTTHPAHPELKRALQGHNFEAMGPEMDPGGGCLCHLSLNARNGDRYPVVCPSDLFVSRYSNLTHTTLELVRWSKRKLRFKSVRHAPQLMAIREELTERKILLKTR